MDLNLLTIIHLIVVLLDILYFLYAKNDFKQKFDILLTHFNNHYKRNN